MNRPNAIYLPEEPSVLKIIRRRESLVQTSEEWLGLGEGALISGRHLSTFPYFSYRYGLPSYVYFFTHIRHANNRDTYFDP